MAVYSKSPILAIIVIGLLLTARMSEVQAVSQFLNDAAFSIVDTHLSIGTSSSTVSPTSMGIISSIPPLTMPFTIPTTATLPMSPTTTTTISPTSPPTSPSSQSDLIQTFNPVSGFDRPAFLRGTDVLDTTSGIFHINDDGCYIFVIHRPGIDPDNPDLALTLIPSTDRTVNETLATIKDTGDGDVITIHVVAELRRGDRVFIANPLSADVIGTEDNPFIYNAFLLYHPPISSSPGMRQSAFSVTVKGDTSREGEALNDYDSPTVNINEDFDADSGTFHVSLKGLYIFHLSVTFTALSMPGGRPAVAIAVNGIQRARVQAFVDMAQPIENVEVTIALPMVKGDTVQLINVFENPEIDCFAVFTGYLLN